MIRKIITLFTALFLVGVVLPANAQAQPTAPEPEFETPVSVEATDEVEVPLPPRGTATIVFTCVYREYAGKIVTPVARLNNKFVDHPTDFLMQLKMRKTRYGATTTEQAVESVGINQKKKFFFWFDIYAPYVQGSNLERYRWINLRVLSSEGFVVSTGWQWAGAVRKQQKCCKPEVFLG